MMKKSWNENDLINQYTKEQLKELLQIQLDHNNDDGAKVVQSAIDQYDTAQTVDEEKINETIILNEYFGSIFKK